MKAAKFWDVGDALLGRLVLSVLTECQKEDDVSPDVLYAQCIYDTTKPFIVID